MAAARAKATTLTVALATERIKTIQGLIQLNSGQEQYCIDIVAVFRALGYTGLTKVTMLVFFTEAKHASLNWTSAAGYTFKVYDSDLIGNPFQAGPVGHSSCCTALRTPLISLQPAG